MTPPPLDPNPTHAEAEAPQGPPAGPPVPPRSRWALVVLLCAAAAAHIPLLPDHLQQASYMGVLFAAFTFTALGLAAALTLDAGPRALAAAGVLCLAAVTTYVATRIVAFPQLGDDVGAWWEPLGVLAILTEIAAVAVAATSLAHAPPAARGR